MIYVVRHGKTDWNVQNKTMGRINIPLNEEGRKQASITSELLKDCNIDLIICSPLDRAKETSAIINNRNINTIYDERLIERAFGDLEGKGYTDDNELLWDITVNTKKYGIEPMEDFKNRVYAFLDEIITIYPDKDILLVTHGGVSALINCYFNNSLYEGPISNKFLKNCSIATYDNNQLKMRKTKKY